METSFHKLVSPARPGVTGSIFFFWGQKSTLGFRNERIRQEKVSVFGLIFSEVSHGKQISQKVSLSGDTLAEYARTGLSLFDAK